MEPHQTGWLWLAPVLVVLLTGVDASSCYVDPTVFADSDLHRLSSLMSTITGCGTLPKRCSAGCGTRDPDQSDGNAQFLVRVINYFDNQTIFGPNEGHASCWGQFLAQVTYIIPDRQEFLRSAECEGHCHLVGILSSDHTVSTCLPASFVGSAVLSLVIIPFISVLCGCTRGEYMMSHKLNEIRAGRRVKKWSCCCGTCHPVWRTNQEIDCTTDKLDKPEKYNPKLLLSTTDSSTSQDDSTVASPSNGTNGTTTHDAVTPTATEQLSEPLIAVVTSKEPSNTTTGESTPASPLSSNVSVPYEYRPLPPEDANAKCCTSRWLRVRIQQSTQWYYRTDPPRDPLEVDWVDEVTDDRVTYATPAPCTAGAHYFGWWSSVIYLFGWFTFRLVNWIVTWETGTASQQSALCLALGVDLSCFGYCAIRGRAFAGFGTLYNAVYTVVKQRRFSMLYTKIEFQCDSHMLRVSWMLAQIGAIATAYAVGTSISYGLYDTDFQWTVGIVSILATGPTAFAAILLLVISPLVRLCCCVCPLQGPRSQWMRSTKSYRHWTVMDEFLLQMSRTLMAVL